MPEILFPILTGLTLVFAGVLLGYFLWFRDRSEHDVLAERLSSESTSQKVELLDAQSRNRELDEKNSRLEDKNKSLEQLCDDLLSSREQIQRHANELETELYSTRTKLDNTQTQLTEECRVRAESEKELLLAKQEQLESQSGVDHQFQDKLNASQILINKVQAELERQLLINNQLQERLQSTSAETAQLRTELSKQREILESTKSRAFGLEKEHISLETNLRSKIELLNESRGQVAAAMSAKEIAESALNESKTHLQKLTGKLAILEDDSRENVKHKERCEHLELTLQMLQERVESVLTQRDDFGRKREQAEQEVVALRNRAKNQQTTIEQLRAQTTATDQRRQNNHQKLLQQIKLLEESKLAVSQQCLELEQEVAAAESSRVKNNETLNRISEDNAHLTAKLTALEKIDRESVATCDEYKARVASVIGQRDSALSAVQKLQDEIKRIRAHAKSNEETIRNLRRERGAILMRNREYASNSYPRIHNESLEFTKADQISSEYGGTVKSDPVRGPVFVEAPRQRDDLKKIYGIAQVLEERLNEFGIYTFKQIMEWDDKAVTEFSELLAFKDRISRDDWMGQAAQLYYKSSGKDAA